jgi:Tfp pilus assembly protein PilX
MKSQSGAVLVVALILLLVLTILGVSSMTNTSLEERMAANSQERTRAMQAADSGVNSAFRQIATVNVTAWKPGSTPMMNSGGSYYVTRYLTATDPPISAGDKGAFGLASGLQAYYFDIQSTGGNRFTAAGTMDATNNTSTVIVNGGIYQMGSKGN